MTRRTALIIGATGGIGRAFVDNLRRHDDIGEVIAWSRTELDIEDLPGRPVRQARVDITNEATIRDAANSLGEIDLAIVATGILHVGCALAPEKSWKDLDAKRLQHTFAVNAAGPALVAKHVLPHLPRSRRAVFAALSARVGSIADNRLGGWYGYRASKAALNQIIKTLSIELGRSHPDSICVSLHPGTVATALSAPFQGNVSDEQLFEPARAAAQMLDVLEGLQAADSGGHFAYDGHPVPF